MKQKKTIVFLVLGLITLVTTFLLGKSYALFETNTISKSAVTIKVGTMNPILGLDLYVKAGEADTFVVTLENGEDVSGKFLLYYKGTLPSGVTFGYLEEEGMNVPSKDGVVLAKGEKQTYSLYVNNQSSNDISIDLQAIGGLSNQSLALPSGGNYIEKTELKNKRITNIFAYNETVGSSTFCVTGEESTCVQIEAPKTYTAGTIIKYKVNDSEEKYFHVVSDNGDTLTLQQRENTVYKTAWYSASNNNKQGPTTILPALEEATSGWTNVLDQTYTFGTTIFKDDANTGCDFDSTNKVFKCTTNTFTLGQRTAKARMITVQEASSFGCTRDNQSCPVWLHNYLAMTTDYGGTVNQSGGDYGNNQGYWTMNARSSDVRYAWIVYFSGTINDFNTPSPYAGGRAVVVIKK